MMDNVPQMVYTCAGALRWVKDKDSVIIVAEQTGVAYTLCGVEAALWGWLMLGYTHRHLVELLSAVLRLPAGAGARKLNGILDNWRAQGLLQREDGTHG